MNRSPSVQPIWVRVTIRPAAAASSTTMPDAMDDDLGVFMANSMGLNKGMRPW